MPGVRLTWKPPDGLKKMTRRLTPTAKRSLYNKLQLLMLAMVGEHHRRGGTKRRWERPWRWANRRIMSWWIPSAGRPRLVNRRRWATDFYYGHGYRITRIPAHYRRIRRSAKLYGQKRKRKQTVAITTVRSHNRRIRPRPPHPIWWTRRYIRRAERLILKQVLK